LVFYYSGFCKQKTKKLSKVKVLTQCLSGVSSLLIASFAFCAVLLAMGSARYSLLLRSARVAKPPSEKLKEYWSPEQIMGRLELDKKIKISTETAYCFVLQDKAIGGALYKYLRHQHKSQGFDPMFKWSE
jgi:hypothetical protein